MDEFLIERIMQLGSEWPQEIRKQIQMFLLPFYLSFSLVSLQDIFEKVNKAYEFLCSKSSRTVQGPDPHNIVLILKSQSILFKRYQEGMIVSFAIFD